MPDALEPNRCVEILGRREPTIIKSALIFSASSSTLSLAEPKAAEYSICSAGQASVSFLSSPFVSW